MDRGGGGGDLDSTPRCDDIDNAAYDIMSSCGDHVRYLMSSQNMSEEEARKEIATENPVCVYPCRAR